LEIKQVIVVRKDLNMRKGKIAAQVAHASMKIFFDKMSLLMSEINKGTTLNLNADRKKIWKGSFNLSINFDDHDYQIFSTCFTDPMLQWLRWKPGAPGFTKIVVSCDNEQELYVIENKAKEMNIPHALIVDNGLTEFHGVPTPTCICLGPDEVSKIDLITSKYSLL
jgi:peptidyl-tRNA hydrolase, PTH2 family